MDFMSEQPDKQRQDLQTNGVGLFRPALFGFVAMLLFLGLSWLFLPSVRVLGYQTVLIVGPSKAREWTVKKLEGYKELAVSPLVIALKDEDEDVRCFAAQALRKGRRAEKAVTALIEALGDKDDEVRKNAARALTDIGPKATAIPALIKALDNNRNERVDEKIAEAIAKIGPRAIPALIEALGHKTRDVRQHAAYALACIGRASPGLTEKAIPALIEALADSERGEWPRFYPCALGETGPKAIPALIVALRDNDPCVREGAAWSFAIIGWNNENPNSGPPRGPGYAANAVPRSAIAALIVALGDKDKYVRQSAAKALGELAQDAGPRNAKVPDHGPRDGVSNAEKAVSQAVVTRSVVTALIAALKDKDDGVHENAAWALGKIGRYAPRYVRKAVSDLIKALKDRSSKVRENAAWALGKIGPAFAEKAVSQAVVTALISALGDRDEYVRQYAANALEEVDVGPGNAGPALVEKAVRALTAALGDKESNVRQAAKATLEKIQNK
jgi:HEAT repeat protein